MDSSLASETNLYSRDLPTSAENLTIGLLHLPKRAHNALKRKNISKLGILFALNDAQLKKVPKLGPSKIQKINEAKAALLNSIDETGEIDWYKYWNAQNVLLVPKSIKASTSHEEIIADLPRYIKLVLNQESDQRLWIIIQRRFGLEGAEVLTFEKLGIAVGLSQERIRQLGLRALQNLKNVLIRGEYAGKKYHVHPKLITAIQHLSTFIKTETANAITEDELMECIHEQYNLNPETIKPSLFLLLTLSGANRLEFDNPDLVPVWGAFTPAQERRICRTVETLHYILTEETALSMAPIDLLVRLNKKVKQADRLSLEQLNSLITLCSTIEQHDKDVYWGKFEYLKGRGNQAERILTEKGEPMHINAITREINHRLALDGQRTVKVKNIRNQMSSDERFVPIERRGEWGLVSWSGYGHRLDHKVD